MLCRPANVEESKEWEEKMIKIPYSKAKHRKQRNTQKRLSVGHGSLQSSESVVTFTSGSDDRYSDKRDRRKCWENDRVLKGGART